MRPAQLADVETAVRFLLRHPPAQHAGLTATLLDRAAIAEKHCLKSGIPHPLFGCGTLMSVACKFPLAPRPQYLDVQACSSFISVFNGLREQQRNQ